MKKVKVSLIVLVLCFVIVLNGLASETSSAGAIFMPSSSDISVNVTVNNSIFFPGDRLTIGIDITANGSRFYQYDVFIALVFPNNGVFFLSENFFDPLTITETPYKRNIFSFQENYILFDSEVPRLSTLSGSYKIIAAVCEAGSNLSTIMSNIASKDFVIAVY